MIIGQAARLSALVAVAACAGAPLRAEAPQPAAPPNAEEGIWTGADGCPRELFVSTAGCLRPVAGASGARLAVSGAPGPSGVESWSASLLDGHLPIVILKQASGQASSEITIVPDLFADSLWAFVRVEVRPASGSADLRVIAEPAAVSGAALTSAEDRAWVLQGGDVFAVASAPPIPGEVAAWRVEPDATGAATLYLALPAEPIAYAKDAGLPRPTATDFADRLQRVGDWWRARLHDVELKLPDRANRQAGGAVADAWYQSLAQILIARNGAALRPGPGEDGPFLLDSAAFQCAALDSAGLHDAASDSLRFMLRSQMRGGQFPHAFADIKALAPDRWWRSQGQAVFAVATHFRLTQDREWLQAVYPALRRACDFLIETRKPQLADALLGKPEYGLLPPSGAPSEGPTACLYADDYWAVYALQATADLAEELERGDEAERYRQAARDLSRWLERSIDQVAAAKALQWAPASTDGGDARSAALAMARAVWPARAAGQSGRVVNTLFMVYSHQDDSSASRKGPGPAGPDAHQPADGWSDAQRLALDHALLELGRPDSCWGDIESASRGMPLSRPGDAGGCTRDAEFVLLLRDALLSEREGGLALMQGAPPRWWSEPTTIDVARAPTAFGPVSLSFERRPRQGDALLKLTAAKRDSVPKYIVYTPPGLRVAKALVGKRPVPAEAVRDGSVELPGEAQRVRLILAANRE